MAGTTRKNKHKPMTAPPAPDAPQPSDIPHSLASLRHDPTLWHKLLLLIHDLQNLRSDVQSQRRMDQATDPLYISAPYFSAAESASVESAIVDEGTGTTVEQALTAQMENFLEKRRASDDWRPCGPHDLAPVFRECFGVAKAELEGEGFLRRVRKERSGREGG